MQDGCGHNTNNRVAVGPFVGQRCERSELPCPDFGSGNIGRRPWSFLSQSVRWMIIMVYCACNRLYYTYNRLNGLSYLYGWLHGL